MKNSSNTEKKIINAARKVFYEKGFKGATMREIATKANTNLALVNYYFRSKENLIYIIHDETFMVLLNQISNCIQQEISIEEKIKNIIHEYIDFFIVNPHIPSFISGEIIRNPKKIAGIMKEKISRSNIHSEFGEQVKEHVKTGVFKPQTTTLQIFTNILSLTIFPVLSQPILKETFSLNDEEFRQFMLNRKNEISRMIINSIKA